VLNERRKKKAWLIFSLSFKTLFIIKAPSIYCGFGHFTGGLINIIIYKE